MRRSILREALARYEDIVVDESFRIGRVPGFDLEDLQQEGRIAVSRAIEKMDPSKGDRHYVRVCVHNALVHVKTKATTKKRVPHDDFGRRVKHIPSLDAPYMGMENATLLDTLPVESLNEDTATTRELLRALEDQLSRREMGMLVQAFAEGGRIGRDVARQKKPRDGMDRSLEGVRRRARSILMRLVGRAMLHDPEHRVDVMQEETTMAPKKKITLPTVPDDVDCHASKPAGPGYDPQDMTCIHCPDKFTCLRDLIEDRTKNEKGLTLASDNEVQAVLAGEMTYDDAKARMKKRNAYVKENKIADVSKIPEELNTTKSLIAETEEAEDEDDADDEKKSDETKTTTTKTDAEGTDAAKEGDDESEDDSDEDDDNETEADGDSAQEDATMATKKSKGKTTKAKKTAGARPAKAPKAKQTGHGKGGPRGPRIPKSQRTEMNGTGGQGGSKRYLSQPRALTEEQMSGALERVKIGTDFTIAVGMELVRKQRDGEDIVIKIKKDGFELNGEMHSSLSSAAAWATKRSVSGNDMFNIEKHSCVEVRGKGVPGGVVSKQGQGAHAVLGATGRKKGPAKPAKKGKAKKSTPPPPKKGKKGKK